MEYPLGTFGEASISDGFEPEQRSWLGVPARPQRVLSGPLGRAAGGPDRVTEQVHRPRCSARDQFSAVGQGNRYSRAARVDGTADSPAQQSHPSASGAPGIFARAGFTAKMRYVRWALEA
ncbi:predicted protein [Streptomyces sp. AA4]|nr:predicted protein [Streptomyces sp. AA4]